MSRQRFPCFVSFHSWPNCFGYAVREGFRQAQLPPTLPPLGFFRLRHCENENVQANVQILGAPPFSTLLLNAAFARLIGLDERDEVILESLPPPLSANVVEIAPLTSSDYQILESDTNAIESGLLSQLRIVSQRARFVFHLSPTMAAAFRVVSLTPAPPPDRICLLSSATELHVQSAPSLPTALPSPASAGGGKKRRKERMVERAAERTSTLLSSTASSYSLLTSSPPIKDELILRILPSSLRTERRMLEHPSVIYAIDPTAQYTTIHAVRACSTVSSSSSSLAVLVRLGGAYLPEEEDGEKRIREALMTYPGHAISPSPSFVNYERVLIRQIPSKGMCHLERAVGKYPKSIKLELADAHLRSLLSSHPIIMTLKGVQMRIPGHSAVISLAPDPAAINGNAGRLCFVADENTLISLVEDDADHEQQQEDKEPKEAFRPFDGEPDDRVFELSWQSSLTSRLLTWLDSPSSEGAHFEGRCVLITGAPGSGKSSQLRHLGRAAVADRRAYCVHAVDGTMLKGRSAEALDKRLGSIVDSLAARSSSILLLDNLDLIASGQEEEQRVVPVERVFAALWRLLHARRGVHVVATAVRLSSLHSSLIGGGRRFFQRMETIEGLGQIGRADVLRAAVEKAREKEGESRVMRKPSLATVADWETSYAEVARSLENASIEELVKIVRRCEIEAWMPGREGIMTPEDLIKVAAEWRKKGENGKKKSGKVEKKLVDMGGMHQQKKLMQEVMLWPYKYSSLFSRFRIRLGRGIILHGPSGCGKTLLAQAMVAESGFNLISVKGPELLSKYIGSSEENVRAVFEKARAAAPSVLFFDEIDSLAPRRGSDTSGVSDRVVNQLLTEMDGAEGLTGVFVLASTSRLDLIDEALIRPGRFDYSIHCGVPDENDRLEILEVLLREAGCGRGKKMNLNSLLGPTEGWTGADLKTLTTNAFFKAREEVGDEEVDDDCIILTKAHLESVLEESKPRMRRIEEKGLGIEREKIGIAATQA